MHLYNALPNTYLMAGHRMVARLEPENRRENHNRHFHSLIGQIAKQLGPPYRTLLIQRTPSGS